MTIIYLDSNRKPNKQFLKDQSLELDSLPILEDDDPYSVILARALLLFLLTFDVFLNAYVMMSLDRDDLTIGLLTIIISVLGQFAAITGQFGYKIGSLLLRTFVISDLMLLIISFMMQQMAHNFMTKISFTLSLLGFLVGILIWYKGKAKTRLLVERSTSNDDLI